MEYRLAVPDDAEELRRLNEAFNGVDDVSASDIRRALCSGREVVAVACENGTCAGFCCAQVHHSFCYAAPAAEITEMYIDPIYRRQGCGRKLLRFMEQQLIHTFGVDECHLLTGCGNLPAQALYQRAGYLEKREMYLSKPCAVPPNP